MIKARSPTTRHTACRCNYAIAVTEGSKFNTIDHAGGISKDRTRHLLVKAQHGRGLTGRGFEKK